MRLPPGERVLKTGPHTHHGTKRQEVVRRARSKPRCRWQWRHFTHQTEPQCRPCERDYEYGGRKGKYGIRPHPSQQSSKQADYYYKHVDHPPAGNHLLKGEAYCGKAGDPKDTPNEKASDCVVKQTKEFRCWLRPPKLEATHHRAPQCWTADSRATTRSDDAKRSLRSTMLLSYSSVRTSTSQRSLPESRETMCRYKSPVPTSRCASHCKFHAQRSLGADRHTSLARPTHFGRPSSQNHAQIASRSPLVQVGAGTQVHW